MALKTITSFQLTPDWHYGGSTAKLRLYYGDSFVDNEGRSVIGGAIGSQGFYKEVNITIASLVATVDSFPLVTTEDSDHPNVKVTGVLYDENGTRQDTIFEWAVPSDSTIASPATFAVMEAYNDRRSPINPSIFYQTQAQVIILFNALLNALGFGPATQLIAGKVRLRTAAADPADPEVFGTNDPLARDATKWLGVELDVTMATPANQNIPIFNATTGKWEPDEAFATVPPHASSHQDGGTDEISVEGLSGLLADAQIPITEAVQDIAGAMATDSATIDFTYDDGAGTLSADVSALGTPASGDLSNCSGDLSNCTADGTNPVGFKNIPQNSQSADYTTDADDAGGHILHPTADNNPRTYTIDKNADVPYPLGTAITFANLINTITIAIDTDTLIWAEDGSTGSRTLAQWGMATALKVTSTSWLISGTGLS